MYDLFGRHIDVTSRIKLWSLVLSRMHPDVVSDTRFVSMLPTNRQACPSAHQTPTPSTSTTAATGRAPSTQMSQLWGIKVRSFPPGVSRPLGGGLTLDGIHAMKRRPPTMSNRERRARRARRTMGRSSTHKPLPTTRGLQSRSPSKVQITFFFKLHSLYSNT